MNDFRNRIDAGAQCEKPVTCARPPETTVENLIDQKLYRLAEEFKSVLALKQRTPISILRAPAHEIRGISQLL